MPVEFLTEEQKTQYGCFSGEPNDVQLARYFHLDNTDLKLINKRRRDYSRLGFALQLTTVRFLGTFLSDPTEVPRGVLHFISRQLSITNFDCLNQYMERYATRYEHSKEIQIFYGYHEFNAPPWRFRLSRLLYSKAWVSNERPSLMFDYATSWLIQYKILLPGVSTLSRLISEIRERVNHRLWRQLASLPTLSQKRQLLELLDVPKEKRCSEFDRLRRGPTTVSGPSFNDAVSRYLKLKAIGMSTLDFSKIPPVRLKHVARHASTMSSYDLTRMKGNKKIALLSAFARVFEMSALDDALDVLDLLIVDITNAAKRLGKKNRLRTLKDLDQSALALASACSVVLCEETSDENIREAIFSQHSKDRLESFIETVKELARPADDNFHDELVEQYGRVKRFLPQLLKHIEFSGTASGEVVLEAFNYLLELGTSRKQVLSDAPTAIISQSWNRLVFDEKERINKKGYVLCFLEKLQDKLRRRDVFALNSERWGDPREKLMQERSWEANRVQVCRALGHSVNVADVISELSHKLDASYKAVAANFDTNNEVRIDDTGKNPSLTITNLDKLDDPPSLEDLKGRVSNLLPSVDLTELLLEIHALTGFADEFSHVSESSARVDDLHISVCAVLMAEACNIGIEPLIRPNNPALTKHRLNWVKQNYIRSDTLIAANAKLVDHQATLPLAKRWGGGEVASADGMRFVTPVKTLNSGPNRKYFGSGCGGTWYNFMSNQFSGFHGIFIPGTLRDSIFLLEGVLEQETSLRPMEIMTDTAGASDVIFGLFWLLGYQFSPRLADAGEAKFWRIDPDADYGALNEIARGKINLNHIEPYWEDTLRIAGSLKLGTIRASELIRTLLNSKRPSSLAKAVIELGRINKTLYLLNYIDDEDYRRRILTQLNRGESRHALARAVCHGQRGEIRKRYREGQEDQLGALGLVVNAIVLWNTIYMQAALDHLRSEGVQVDPEDEARLSPLGRKHINMLGKYSFSLAEQVIRGELRPLKLTEDEWQEEEEPELEY